MPATATLAPPPLVVGPAQASALQIRCPRPNDNHHLWRNGRLWWVAFTVLNDGWRQERIRRSLGTANVEEARRRRDALFDEYRRTCALTDDTESRARDWLVG